MKVRVLTVGEFVSGVSVVDAEREEVVSEIRNVAVQAAETLRSSPFNVFRPEWAVEHAVSLRQRSHPSAKIWTYTPKLYCFESHIRQFAIGADASLWAQRYFRDWDFLNDIDVAYPLGDIRSCYFGTGVLRGELLPALQAIAASSR